MVQAGLLVESDNLTAVGRKRDFNPSACGEIP